MSSGSDADTTADAQATYDFGFDITPTLVVVSGFGAETLMVKL